MDQPEVDKKIVIDRMDVIQKSLERLKQMRELDAGRFMTDDNFAIAEHYLRYALEAIFDICSHILAGIPGARPEEYKQMALAMAEHEIVPREFAEDKLFKMAGYRNRLTHFYFHVGNREMYEIVQNNLEDIEEFLGYIKDLVEKYEEYKNMSNL